MRRCRPTSGVPIPDFDVDAQRTQHEEVELGLQNRYMVARFLLSVLLFIACPLVWFGAWMASRDDEWWFTRQSKPKTFQSWVRRWCKLMVVALVVSAVVVLIGGQMAISN